MWNSSRVDSAVCQMICSTSFSVLFSLLWWSSCRTGRTERCGQAVTRFSSISSCFNSLVKLATLSLEIALLLLDGVNIHAAIDSRFCTAHGFDMEDIFPIMLRNDQVIEKSRLSGAYFLYSDVTFFNDTCLVRGVRYIFIYPWISVTVLIRYRGIVKSFMEMMLIWFTTSTSFQNVATRSRFVSFHAYSWHIVGSYPERDYL